MGIVKNQSARGGVSVHLVGRDTSLDRKLEPSDCHSQLQPLWSSEYDESTLRYLEGKGVASPNGAEGAVAATAAVLAVAEEHKAYPAAPWLAASSSADSAVSGALVAQTSDASWFLAQPLMWVEAIDAVT